MTDTTKPQLYLTDTKTLTFDQLIDLFRKLTGREPTPEEVEEAEQEWEELQRELGTTPAPPTLDH